MSFTLDCTKIHESEDAVLVECEELGEEWFPLSQVNEKHFNVKTGKGHMEITDWIAKKKGLT